MERIRTDRARSDTSLCDLIPLCPEVSLRVFIIVVIVHHLLLERAHAADELAQIVLAMIDAIRFVKSGKESFSHITGSAWSILFLEMAFASSRWTGIFVLDRRLEVSIDE